ncbi:MAG: BMC domain-containing protein [Erysipelothrix sp.]|jgi:microcompartment protein CcmL/EutN|nr:BMC domain-containing protein [Erysipelothrix sp.]
MNKVESLGIIDVLYLTTALSLVDEMCKASNVKLIACEAALGGKLVTLFIQGSVSDVQEAIEVAKNTCDTKFVGRCKNAVVISKPHKEILKFIM